MTRKLKLYSHLLLSTLTLTGAACLIETNRSFAQLAAEGTTNSATPELKSVTTAIEKLVDEKVIAGAVTAVASKNSLLHWSAVGYSDLNKKTPMKEDDIFWIASMSKPVTGVAVMQMVEEGRVSLDAPISDYLPELKNLTLEDGTPVTITTRQLMTHTSGMAELPGETAYNASNLKEAVERYSKTKVQFTPGSKWSYSQTSINTAARIVEVVSGLPFDRYLQERIFTPLGMKDTAFYLSKLQAQRLVKSYRHSEAGELVETPVWLLVGHEATDNSRMPAANGGLFSTAGDYMKFCRMLLRDGELDGVRILSKESATTFRTQAIDEHTTGFTPGNTWGIGCCIVKTPQGPSKELSTGSFGHGGAYGTQSWIDPTNDRCFVLMIQRADFPNGDASPVRVAFQEEAVKELAKTPK